MSVVAGAAPPMTAGAQGRRGADRSRMKTAGGTYSGNDFD